MTKQALRKLRDDERQTDIGRQIIEKILRCQDHLAHHAPFPPIPNAADDDQRHDDAD